MVCFVESHGEVGLEGFHRPGVGDGALYPVDDGDLLGVGNVDKDAAVAFLQLEGFRVGGQLHAAEEFGGGGVDDGKGAFAVDRKSTRLNSSHANISYAVFCLKKST